ncbi:MAG: patatin-like phospholipase family protein [Mucinivorans sp.]
MKKLFLLFLLFLSLSTSAQRVGMVLAGGGAKGLYHVGIMKALEENSIPIDYVSGASMGAIVGAMYAAGYSPDEMIDFFVTDSVRTWLSGKMPDEYRYYFKRFEPTPEMVSVNINPEKTKFNAIQLPVNIVSPYRIDLAFMSMISPASWAARENFDSLMVPFRCVASDVYNKKLITFRHGSLPFAVRASMTFPFAFKPLTMDSVLLYDGGIYNNFPFQTLEQDFAPDVLIGCICSGNYQNPKQSDLMGQVSVMIANKTNYTLPDSLRDVTIARRFPDIAVLDYSRAAYVIARGYEDAMRQMPEIREKIKRRISPSEVGRRRAAFKAKFKPLIFERINIKGLSPSQTTYVMRQLGITENQLVTADYFQEKYMRVLASEVFTGEFPEVSFNPQTGFYSVDVTMHTKPSMKISIGGNVSSTSLSMAYLGFDYKRVGRSAASYSLRGYFGSSYNSVQIGGRHDFYTQFPFYIDYGYGYEQRNMNSSNSYNYYRNQDWRYDDAVNNYLTTSVAIPVLSNNIAFRGRLTLGITSDNYYTGLHTTADRSDNSRFSYANLTAELQSQTLNFSQYATEGKNSIVSVKFVEGIEDYTPGDANKTIASAFTGRNHNWVELRYMREHYIDCGRWFNIGYMFDLTLSNHRNFQNSVITSITAPSFSPTPHSNTLMMKEFRSPSYLGIGVMPIVKFLPNGNFYLKTYAYAFVPQELFYDGGWMRPTAERVQQNLKYIFGGTLTYQTILGPASITLVKYTTGPKNWSVLFNFGYLIFNGKTY